MRRCQPASINLRQQIDTKEWSSQPSRTLETVAEYTFDENESFHTPLNPCINMLNARKAKLEALANPPPSFFNREWICHCDNDAGQLSIHIAFCTIVPVQDLAFVNGARPRYASHCRLYGRTAESLVVLLRHLEITVQVHC